MVVRVVSWGSGEDGVQRTASSAAKALANQSARFQGYRAAGRRACVCSACAVWSCTLPWVERERERDACVDDGAWCMVHDAWMRVDG